MSKKLKAIVTAFWNTVSRITVVSDNTLLTKNLRDMVAVWQAINAPVGAWLAEMFVLDNGKDYDGRTLPQMFEMGTPKECFQNSANLVLYRPGLRYVEGYAMSKDIMFPFLHAWAIDENNLVVDVTLRKPDNYLYRGVTFTSGEYATNMRRNRCWSMLNIFYSVNIKLILKKDPSLKKMLSEDALAAILPKRKRASKTIQRPFADNLETC